MQTREPRQTVRVTARMKTAQGWHDVAIRNVSAHGMLISAAVPLKRGAYIEVRRAAQVIVARAVWVNGQECGVRTQDAIDIPALIDPNAARAERVIGGAQAERRRTPRPAESGAQAQAVVRRLGFGLTGALVLTAAVGAALAVADLLGRPLQQLNQALAGASAG